MTRNARTNAQALRQTLNVRTEATLSLDQVQKYGNILTFRICMLEGAYQGILMLERYGPSDRADVTLGLLDKISEKLTNIQQFVSKVVDSARDAYDEALKSAIDTINNAALKIRAGARFALDFIAPAKTKIEFLRTIEQDMVREVQAGRTDLL
jgi:hypothetical protein